MVAKETKRYALGSTTYVVVDGVELKFQGEPSKKQVDKAFDTYTKAQVRLAEIAEQQRIEAEMEAVRGVL